MVPELSILVVNYASWYECVGALRSFVAHPPHRADGSVMPWEIVVVDNASPDRDADAEAAIAKIIEDVGGVLVMHDENGGYSTGMNLAMRHARGDFLVVSNPDVIVKDGTFDRLLRRMEQDPGVGAAAPEIFWDEGLTARLPPNILPTLRDLVGLALANVSSRWLRRYNRKRTRGAVQVWCAKTDIDLEMLSGCFFVMKRSFVDQIGFFDERFPLYYEDTDLSQRIRRTGKTITQVHGSACVHLYNRSGQKDFAKALERYWVSRRRYFRKHYGWLGEKVYDAIQWFLNTGWAKRRESRPNESEIHDLGTHSKKPVIVLPDGPRQRFLVEVAMDPYFFLAGGTFGSGDRWVASDSMFGGFGPTTYYFRVVDLEDPSQPQLGIYRYTQVEPQVFEPMDVESTAGVKDGDEVLS